MKRAYHGDWMDALNQDLFMSYDESVEKNEVDLERNDDGFDFDQDIAIDFDE